MKLLNTLSLVFCLVEMGITVPSPAPFELEARVICPDGTGHREGTLCKQIPNGKKSCSCDQNDIVSF